MNQTTQHTSQGLFWGGLALILLGLVIIASPWVSSLAITRLIGLAALASGAVYVLHAFYDPKWSGFFWSLLAGIIAIIGGGILLFNPIPGMIALSLVIAGFIIAQGIAKTVTALTMRKHEGWIWLLLSGIVGIVIGWYIWYYLRTHPLASSAYLIALLFGIDLLITGGSLIALSGQAKHNRDNNRHR